MYIYIYTLFPILKRNTVLDIQLPYGDLWFLNPQRIIPPLSSGSHQEADRWMDFLQTRDFPCGGGTGGR